MSIYNRATAITAAAKSGTFLTKSQAETLFVSKTKDGAVSGSLQVLDDLLLGDELTVTGPMSALGNVTLGNTSGDAVRVIGSATFDAPPTVTTATYSGSDGQKLVTKSYADAVRSWTQTDRANQTAFNFKTDHAAAFNNHKLVDFRDSSGTNYANLEIVPNSTTKQTMLVSGSNGGPGSSTLALNAYSTTNNGIVITGNTTQLLAGTNTATLNTTSFDLNCRAKLTSDLPPTDPLHLVPKKYVDELPTRANTFSASTTFTQPVVSRVTNSGTGLEMVTQHAGPNTLGARCLGLSDINTSVAGKSSNLAFFGNSETNESIILASSGQGVNTGIVDISSWNDGPAFVNGVRIEPGKTTIRGGSGSSIAVDATGLTLSSAPKLAGSYIPPDSDLVLVTRKFVVDALAGQLVASTAGKQINYDHKTTLLDLVTVGDGRRYVLTPPGLGMSQDDNTLTGWRTFHLETYQDFSSFEMCQLDVYRYIQRQATAVSRTEGSIRNNNGDPVTNATDWGVRRTVPWPVEIATTGDRSDASLNQFAIHAFSNVAPVITPAMSSKTLWAGGPVTQKYTYTTRYNTLRTSNYNGILFTYFPSTGPGIPNRITINIGFPTFQNSPVNSNWINQLGCSLHIVNGHDSTMINGWRLSAASTNP